LTISIDTISVNIKGNIQQAIKYKNKYYCFFNENKPYGGFDLHFYLLSEKGIVEKEILVPFELQESYLDLHIRNDSILVKDYYRHTTFFLDTIKHEWRKTKEVDDLIFEDEDYYVTHLDFGEWGGSIWFRNKRDGNVYEMASSSNPIVNKIMNRYYVTLPNRVIEIEDPAKMKKSKPDSCYKVIETKKWSWGSFSNKGTNFLYIDSTLRTRNDKDFHVATSFVFNNSLINLCIDSNVIVLSKIENGKMIAIDTIAHDIKVYNWHNSYRRNLNKDNLQLLHFDTRELNIFGFIEIFDSKINIHYIKNRDKVNLLGQENADKAFCSLFDYITKRMGRLYLSQIDSIETKLNGTDATPRHRISIGKDLYPNKKDFALESPKVYKKIEDSTLTLLSNYYYIKQDSSVKVITYEWTETYEPTYGIYAPENENYKDNQFKNKSEKIISFIESKYGKPLDRKSGKYGYSLDWNPESMLTIYLRCSYFNNYRNISLEIYKE